MQSSLSIRGLNLVNMKTLDVEYYLSDALKACFLILCIYGTVGFVGKNVFWFARLFVCPPSFGDIDTVGLMKGQLICD